MNRYAGKFLATALPVMAAISVYPGAAQAEKISVEVQSSNLERDPKTNDVVVVIELSPAGKTAFENFTERNKGRSIQITVGSTVLLKARLVEKISGGVLRATTKFTEDEGRKVSAQLTRGTLITLEDVDG